MTEAPWHERLRVEVWYTGHPREAGPAQVSRITAEQTKPLDPRHDIRNHSPDGFQWGYGGSGPAQLALALLADATGDDLLANAHYQAFKREVVAKLVGGRGWSYTRAYVLDWLSHHLGPIPPWIDCIGAYHHRILAWEAYKRNIVTEPADVNAATLIALVATYTEKLELADNLPRNAREVGPICRSILKRLGWWSEFANA